MSNNKPQRRTKNTYLVLVRAVVNDETGIYEKIQPVFKTGGKKERFVQNLRMTGLWVTKDLHVMPNQILQVQVNPQGIEDVTSDPETGESIVHVEKRIEQPTLPEDSADLGDTDSAPPVEYKRMEDEDGVGHA
jgi:hypothetical protein